MNIQDIHIYAYRLTCQPPLYIKEKIITKREGWIIEIAAEGLYGFGEVAPLPNFSCESIEEVQEQLNTINNTWPGRKLPRGLDDDQTTLQSALAPDSFAPSVRCGMETAFIDIVAARKQQTLADFFGENGRPCIDVNALISVNSTDAVKEAGDLVEKGYRHIKLKAGNDIDACIEMVIKINQCLHGKAKLHLDANQAWNIGQAIRFGQAVGRGAIRYIEEPFADLRDIPRFYRETAVPVALDESLTTASLKDIRRMEGVHVLVLKPTLHGVLKTRDLMRHAQKIGLTTIISSCYESDIGISFLARLASCQKEHAFAGLDTLKYFKERLLKNSVSIKNGQCRVDHHLADRLNIDFDLLEQWP